MTAEKQAGAVAFKKINWLTYLCKMSFDFNNGNELMCELYKCQSSNPSKYNKVRSQADGYHLEGGSMLQFYLEAYSLPQPKLTEQPVLKLKFTDKTGNEVTPPLLRGTTQITTRTLSNIKIPDIPTALSVPAGAPVWNCMVNPKTLDSATDFQSWYLTNPLAKPEKYELSGQLIFAGRTFSFDPPWIVDPNH